jgi:protein involved in polysaccharide export with SLBB domain
MVGPRSLAVQLLGTLALAFGLVLTASAGAFAAPAPDNSANIAADYRLGTGDKVRVIVYGESDLGGEFQVDATGYARLPMIGQVKAAGLTAHDLEASITTALGNGYLNDPRVNVEVTTYRPFYVIGEVQKPGEYPYANGITASSAIAVAGGFTGKAVESVVYVRHQGEDSEHRMTVTESMPIRPGDVVRVNSTTFWDVMDVISPIAGFSAAVRYTVP